MHGINKNINCILQGKERKLVTSGTSDATGTPVTDTQHTASKCHAFDVNSGLSRFVHVQKYSPVNKASKSLHPLKTG